MEPIVKPSEIVSGKVGRTLTVSSHPRHIAMPPEPHIFRAGNEFYAMDVTANRRYVRPLWEPGPRTQIDDYGIESWKAGAISPPIMHEYVEPVVKRDSSYIAFSFGDKPWHAPKEQTPQQLKFTTDVIIHDYPNNEFGRAVSRAGNLKQDILDFLGTDEGKASAPYLLSVGGKPEDIDYVAIGGLPPGAIFGVGRFNGKEIMYVAEDAYDLIAKDAKHYGMSRKERKNAGILEEITHMWLGHLDDERNPTTIEIEAKSVDAGFYAEREANAASGPPNPRNVKSRERYRRLKEFRIDDISTVPIRYKDVFSRYSRDKAPLREKFAEEARRKGLDKGAVEEYVDGRMAQLEAEDRKSLSEFEALVDREARDIDRESPQPDSKAPREPESREAPAEAAAE